MTIHDILKWIGDYKRVYITGHIYPDGDCIGAALGLKGLLKIHGIDAKVLLDNPPQIYSFLEGYDEIISENPEEVDVLLVVDCNALMRFPTHEESYRKAKVVINIDHHQAPEDFLTEYRWIDPSESSTSEMIYKLYPSGEGIAKGVADAIYTGLIYDTGGFMHSNTKPSTMQAAAHLMECGARYGFIMKKLLYRQTENRLKAKKIALDHFDYMADKKIAYTFITHEEMTSNGLQKEDTEDVVHLLAQLENIESAVFLAEFEKGIYKLSFRSKNNLDVCEVAKAFGGGGHKKAAGASSEMSLQELLPKIEKEIVSRL